MVQSMLGFHLETLLTSSWLCMAIQSTPAESPAPSPLPQRALEAHEQACEVAPATPAPLTTLVVESPCVDVPALHVRVAKTSNTCLRLFCAPCASLMPAAVQVAGRPNCQARPGSNSGTSTCMTLST